MLGLATNLSAQETNKDDGFLNAFTAERAEWIIDYTNYDIPQHKFMDKVILEGDTVIDGMNWRFIKDNWRIGTHLIRVDGQKVIFRPLETDLLPTHLKKETVIYDFSLEVGDSVWVYSWEDKVYEKITQVDSVVLNDGKKHKRLIYNNDELFSFIEGVGSVFESPLCMLIPHVTGSNNNTFVCCHVNDQLLYKNPHYVDCEGVIVANETIQTSDNLKLFMSDDVLNVRFEEEKSFDVAIYSLNGVLLKQRKSNIKEAVIPIYSGKGIFVVRITCGDQTYSRKVYNL